jgi:hypothetical protein
MRYNGMFAAVHAANLNDAGAFVDILSIMRPFRWRQPADYTKPVGV